MKNKLQSIATSRLPNSSRIAQYATTTAATLTLVSTNALAQSTGGGGDFCSTSGGQFVGGLQSGVAGIALAAFVIMLLITVVAKMLPFRGASKIGNMGAGGFVSGILLLTVGISLLQWALTFTPFAASMSCGGLL